MENNHYVNTMLTEENTEMLMAWHCTLTERPKLQNIAKVCNKLSYILFFLFLLSLSLSLSLNQTGMRQSEFLHFLAFSYVFVLSLIMNGLYNKGTNLF